MRQQQKKRAPRYFDSPEWSWLSCYKFGENNDNGEKRKKHRKRKPCYNCGDIGHVGKLCKQVNNCFICLKKGHLIIDCPRKNEEVDSTSRLCLKCGSIGHDMFSCSNDYNSEDLKDTQCYICKKFGHLCCVDNKTERPREASCYNCGRSGHFGSDCIKLNEVVIDLQSEPYCSICGSRDHFQKACIKQSKAGKNALVAKSAKGRKGRGRKKNKTTPTVTASQSGDNNSYQPQGISSYNGKSGSNVSISHATATARDTLNQQTGVLLHSHQNSDNQVRPLTMPTVNASQNRASNSNRPHTTAPCNGKSGSNVSMSPTTARDILNQQTRGLLPFHQNSENQVRTQVPRNSLYPMTQQTGVLRSRDTLNQQTGVLLHSHQNSDNQVRPLTMPMVNASQSRSSNSNRPHTTAPCNGKSGSNVSMSPTTANDILNQQTRGLLSFHQNSENQVRTQVPRNSLYPMTQLPHRQGTQTSQQPIHHQTGVQLPHTDTRIFQNSFYPTTQNPHLTWNNLRGTQIPQQPFIHQTGNLLPQQITQVYRQHISHQTRNLLPRPITQILQPVSYLYQTGNTLPQPRTQIHQQPLNHTTGILLPHRIRAPVPQTFVIRVEIRPSFPNRSNQTRS